MEFQKGFSLPIILAIIAVILVAGGVGAFLYITNNTNPQLGSGAYTPATQNVQLPTPDSESGFKTPAPSAASPAASPPKAAPVSSVSIPTGQVSTSTSLSADKKTFTIDFLSSSNFAGITSIIYNLTYTADSGNRAVNGIITISSETIIANGSGQQYIRKLITVGTCSVSCTYDTNPKNFHLSLSVK